MIYFVSLSPKTSPTVFIQLGLIFIMLSLLLAACSKQSNLPTDNERNLESEHHSNDEALNNAAGSLEALENHSRRKVPLPNYVHGPGRPQPIGSNFYEQREYYPGYLLCSFYVDEKHYDPLREPQWFESSLAQMRSTGKTNFPSFKFAAIIILNVESNFSSAFERDHTAGAIFKAADVFNKNINLKQLVADVPLDHHPFQFDSNRPTPAEQQIWLIVEHHEMTNRM